MKNLAEFKRKLTLGSLWHTHFCPSNKSMGDRAVSRVQSNGIAFRTERGTDSWLHFPPARLFRPIDEKSCTILNEDGTPLLTYTYLREKADV